MITIGYDFEHNNFIKKDKDINELEAAILEYISNNLECNDPLAFKISANSSNYTTLSYLDVDIVRVKQTPKTSWIKIMISNDDNKTQRDNPIFANQKNKGESFWICDVDDLDVLYPFINRTILMIESWQ